MPNKKKLYAVNLELEAVVIADDPAAARDIVREIIEMSGNNFTIKNFSASGVDTLGKCPERWRESLPIESDMEEEPNELSCEELLLVYPEGD